MPNSFRWQVFEDGLEWLCRRTRTDNPVICPCICLFSFSFSPVVSSCTMCGGGVGMILSNFPFPRLWELTVWTLALLFIFPFFFISTFLFSPIYTLFNFPTVFPPPGLILLLQVVGTSQEATYQYACAAPTKSPFGMLRLTRKAYPFFGSPSFLRYSFLFFLFCFLFRLRVELSSLTRKKRRPNHDQSSDGGTFRPKSAVLELRSHIKNSDNLPPFATVLDKHLAFSFLFFCFLIYSKPTCRQTKDRIRNNNQIKR